MTTQIDAAKFRLTTRDREYYGRQVAMFINDLSDIPAEDRLPPPPKRTSNNVLVCCLQDYFHIYSLAHMVAMADYEQRAIIINIVLSNEKQLVLVPHKGLGVVNLVNGVMPAKAHIELIKVMRAVRLFKQSSQSIADAIDLAMYRLGCIVQKRFKTKHPDHNYRLGGADTFPHSLQLVGPSN